MTPATAYYCAHPRRIQRCLWIYRSSWLVLGLSCWRSSWFDQAGDWHRFWNFIRSSTHGLGDYRFDEYWSLDIRWYMPLPQVERIRGWQICWIHRKIGIFTRFRKVLMYLRWTILRDFSNMWLRKVLYTTLQLIILICSQDFYRKFHFEFEFWIVLFVINLIHYASSVKWMME